MVSGCEAFYNILNCFISWRSWE